MQKMGTCEKKGNYILDSLRIQERYPLPDSSDDAL